MANTDKNILITPNVGSANDPQIVFSGASATLGPQTITVKAKSDYNGTLSFEGSAGQLFSITNSLTGVVYSINLASGIPVLEALDTGEIKLSQYSGFTNIAGTTDSTSSTTGVLRVAGGVGIAKNLYVGGAVKATNTDGPTFRAVRASTAQTVTASARNKVQFNSESWDTDNAYDNSTNYRFQPAKAGYYSVNVSVGGPNQNIVSVYRNGSEYLVSGWGSGGSYTSLTGIVYLNGSSDYVEGYVWTDGTSIDASASGTVFSAVMIRGA